MKRKTTITHAILSILVIGGLFAFSTPGSAQDQLQNPVKKTVSAVTSHPVKAQDEGCYVVPTPCLTPSMSLPEMPPIDRPVWRDEVLLDGGDRRLQVKVDDDWDVHGLDVEDTVAHFDTLRGDRLVQPSNRVGIYSPRFRAVRKITNLIDTRSNLQMATVDETTELNRARSSDFSSTTLQNLSPQRNRSAMTPSGFRDRTRGVYVDNTVVLDEFQNRFKTYEDLATIRYGSYQNNEKARLATSIQNAISWSSDLTVLSAVRNLNLLEAKDVRAVQETVEIRNQLDKPAIRLVKVASKMAAEVEEEVEFTLRFDNVGNQVIGNVTIIDNLTGRLEYIEGSGQCSVDAELVLEPNEAGSTRLRWEITDPIEVGHGGIIRFRCKVR